MTLPTEHKGWTGEPYESDFESIWGLIKREDILDCRNDAGYVKDDVVNARNNGYRYFLTRFPSTKAKGHLYMVRGASSVGLCVYQYVAYQSKRKKKQSDKYNGSIDAKARQICRAAQTRAKNKGIPYDLDMDNIVARFERGICEVTGIPFSWDKCANNRNPFAASIDKIDPDGGYTMDNVQIVCWIYNHLKSNYAIEDLNTFLNAMRNQPPLSPTR